MLKAERNKKTSMAKEFGKPRTRGSLKRIFGRVAAVASLVGTLVFYGLGFQIGHAYYQQWQANKAETTQTQVYDAQAEFQQQAHKDYTSGLPWLPALGALGLAYGAGFAGMAAAKSRRKDYDEYYRVSYSSRGGYYNSGYHSHNDGFWLGYVLGNSNGGGGGGYRSSSSNNNNGGAAAAVVIIGAVALAAGASVVSYKSLKENFKPDPDRWKKADAELAEKEAKEALLRESKEDLFKKKDEPLLTIETSEIPEISGRGGKAKPFSL